MRVRITFSKDGALRYTGHLDLHRIWERTCRRAGIPLSYSQGFHPQPRISLAAALPLGFIGKAELIDLWLDQDEDLKIILKDLQTSAPPGLVMNSIQLIDDHAPSLQSQVESATYDVSFLDPMDPDILFSRSEQIFAASSIPRNRRGKDYDLRPLIHKMEMIKTVEEGFPGLKLQLAASPASTGRPEEVISALGFDPGIARITRTGLILKN
jgi:radical SAM-linked protein